MSKNRERQRTIKRIEIVGSIIVVLDLSLVSILLLHDHAYKLFHYLFSTDGPSDAYHFQWVGITVFVTGLGLFINDRQKKADNKAIENRRLEDNRKAAQQRREDQKEAQQRLKAQSSIDWMDEFRHLVAELSIVSFEAQEAARGYNVFQIFKRSEEVRLEKLDEARKQQFALEKVHRLLYLYTPQSDTTKPLQKSIEAVFDKSKKNIADMSSMAGKILAEEKDKIEFMRVYDAGNKELKQLNDNMIELASQYLGHEWQQAIGELTGETKSNNQ